MNISLTPELEELVNKKVKSGMYHSASEVIRAGLRLLREQDELRELKLAELRKEIQKGFDDIEAGRVTTHDEESLKQSLEEIKVKGRKKLSERKIRAA